MRGVIVKMMMKMIAVSHVYLALTHLCFYIKENKDDAFCIYTQFLSTRTRAQLAFKKSLSNGLLHYLYVSQQPCKEGTISALQIRR